MASKQVYVRTITCATWERRLHQQETKNRQRIF